MRPSDADAFARLTGSRTALQKVAVHAVRSDISPELAHGRTPDSDERGCKKKGQASDQVYPGHCVWPSAVSSSTRRISLATVVGAEDQRAKKQLGARGEVHEILQVRQRGQAAASKGVRGRGRRGTQRRGRAGRGTRGGSGRGCDAWSGRRPWVSPPLLAL